MVSNFFWNSRRPQSIILMIRWGGLANFLTVAMSAALMVCGDGEHACHNMNRF